MSIIRESMIRTENILAFIVIKREIIEDIYMQYKTLLMGGVYENEYYR